MYHAVTLITKRQTGNFFPLFLQHPFPFGLAFDLLVELIQGIFHHFGSFPVTGRFSFGCFFFSGSLLFLPSFLCSIIPDHLFLPKIPAVCNCLQICPFPSWLSTDTLCTKGRFGVLAAIVCKPLFYIHISCYILFIIQYICMFPTISGFSGTLLRLLHFPFFFQPFLSAFTEIQFIFWTVLSLALYSCSCNFDHPLYCFVPVTLSYPDSPPISPTLHLPSLQWNPSACLSFAHLKFPLQPDKM